MHFLKIIGLLATLDGPQTDIAFKTLADLQQILRSNQYWPQLPIKKANIITAMLMFYHQLRL